MAGESDRRDRHGISFQNFKNGIENRGRYMGSKMMGLRGFAFARSKAAESCVRRQCG